MSPSVLMPSTARTSSDAMSRHAYGINKRYHHGTSYHATSATVNQCSSTIGVSSATSNGGGRAWSDDEEAYLLQTRLQKMPYKHIAAHLKKTELACRLHYHQLSHGSNRRKRAPSVASQRTSASPTQTVTQPSVAQQRPLLSHGQTQTPTPTPPGSSGYSMPSMQPIQSLQNLSMAAGGVQLPSITANMSTPSPRMLPAILPKPSAASSTGSPILSLSPPSPAMPRYQSTRVSLLPAATFTQTSTASAQQRVPSLRLDCSGLPAPSLSSSVSSTSSVDLARLHAIYDAHQQGFWTSIASDYGHGVSPAILEQAWRESLAHRSSSLAPSLSQMSQHSHISQQSHQTATPLTPGSTSPVDDSVFYRVHKNSYTSHSGFDKTRISAILGNNADSGNRGDREMMRRPQGEHTNV